MSDLFDTMKIRDEPEYWDSLAARVTRNAISRGRRGRGLARFAGSPVGWMAATILAGIAATFVLISRSISPAREMGRLGESLQPSDEIGRQIGLHASPPSVGALLLGAEQSGRVR